MSTFSASLWENKPGVRVKEGGMTVANVGFNRQDTADRFAAWINREDLEAFDDDAEE
jgi:hypothetical protein